VRSLIGARFLDDRRADHTLKSVVSRRHDRHEKQKNVTNKKKDASSNNYHRVSGFSLHRARNFYPLAIYSSNTCFMVAE